MSVQGLLRFDAKYKQSFIDQLRNEGFREKRSRSYGQNITPGVKPSINGIRGLQRIEGLDARLKKIDELEKIDGKTDGKKDRIHQHHKRRDKKVRR